MRKVAPRNLLLFAGISALVLAAFCPTTFAKKSTMAARAGAEVAPRAHVAYTRHWKKGHRTMSRRLTRGQGRANVHRRAPRPLASEWDDLTIQCLLSQPFVICP